MLALLARLEGWLLAAPPPPVGSWAYVRLPSSALCDLALLPSPTTATSWVTALVDEQ